MSFFWVQQWVALPVVYEQPMGDLPPSSRSHAMDNAVSGFSHEGNTAASTSAQFKSTDDNAPFPSRPDHRSSTYLGTPYQFPEQAASPMNMGAMAGALPDYVMPDENPLNTNLPSTSRSLSGASPSAVGYPLGQNVQMSMHANAPVPTHMAYGAGFPAGSYQQNFTPSQGAQNSNYASFGINAPRLGGPVSVQSPYQNYPPTSQYMYYPAPYGSHSQFSPSFGSQGAQAQAQALYGRRGSFTNATGGGHTGETMNYGHNDGIYSGMRTGAPGNYQSNQAAMSQSYGASHTQVPGK
ncbi:hypothetical protein J1614_011818 [Plenodomus biglobosus]|nr:hypothetical protein J1614_011818 [Plenodomus biglobosus]